MTNARPILITGAAGQVGAVGRSVTEMLIDRGLKVRALVRTEDARADYLRKRGAEVVVGNLLELHDVHRAVAGCDRVYFGMSITASYLEAAANVAAVLKHHGVEAFVNISQMTVAEMSIQATTRSPQQKQHWLAEQIFTWANLPVVEVRPTIFLDGFFLRVAAPMIGSHNKLALPFGLGKTSPVAGFDTARVIAEILADPSRHIGNTYHLTGPVTQDLHGIAQEYSMALGRPIEYVNVPLEPWKERLAKSGMPAHLVEHLATMALLHQDGRYDRSSDDVERLTGDPPMTVREFVQKNVAAFMPSAA
jgi:uncharacterized protein YbjT (DUF2867 family)